MLVVDQSLNELMIEAEDHILVLLVHFAQRRWDKLVVLRNV